MQVVNEIMVRGIVVGVFFKENCWIVGNRQSGEAVCIDPGDNPDEILALARDLGVHIKFIVNSHGHFDHVLGVRGVQAATGARFLLSEADVPVLRSGWKDASARFGLDAGGAPPDPDGYVTDGDTIDVEGLQLRAIATPGHTPGSTSYYVNGLLFTGDTLFRSSVGRTNSQAAFDQELESICERLLVLPGDTRVLPGHMKETTIAFEKQTNPFVREWVYDQGTRAASQP